jgi:hypothetical protein
MSTITSSIRRIWQEARERAVPDLQNVPPSVRDEFLDNWWAGKRDEH